MKGFFVNDNYLYLAEKPHRRPPKVSRGHAGLILEQLMTRRHN